MTPQRRINVLILDPERDVGELFARALETHRESKCYLAASVEEAFDLLRDLRFDLVLVDLNTVVASDFDLLKRLRSASPHSLLLIDAYLHQKPSIARALQLGAHGYIIKPIQVQAFREKIDALCARPAVQPA